MTTTSFTFMFNVLGLYVRFGTNSNELSEKISKDFSYFKKSGIPDPKKVITIYAFLEKPDFSVLKGGRIWRKSKNSTTYDVGETRYNDYRGKLLSVYDYSKDEGRLWSEDGDKLHEVTYLLILSITGKKLDTLGLHRVHAMAAVYRGVCFVGMMDMGVGKSTLLGHMLVDREVALLSDDIPVVDGQGRFRAFPLRLGLGDIPEALRVRDVEKNVYTIKREFYGTKKLLCLDGIENGVAGGYGRLVIFEGRRAGEGSGVSARRGSPLRLFFALLKHMVVGVGTPVIFEYFWRRGWRDFWVKAHIALLRLGAALVVASENEFYTVFLGNDYGKNADFIKNRL